MTPKELINGLFPQGDGAMDEFNRAIGWEDDYANEKEDDDAGTTDTE